MPATFEANREELQELADGAIPGLKGNWTEAEDKLLTSIAIGIPKDCTESEGKQKTVHAELLEWLLTHRAPRSMLHPRGIQISGMVVEKPIDLTSTRIDIPIWMTHCTFKKDIILRRARVQSLSLQGSQCRSIQAEGIEVKGDVFLRGDFKAEGEVNLLGAVIGGSLDCTKGKFENPATDRRPAATALSADRIKVKGSVFLSGEFKAEGEVRLLGAVIGGALNCFNGKFKNSATDKRPDAKALVADQIEVKGSVFLSGEFKAEGGVRLPGAVIGGTLSCINGKFKNSATDKRPDAKALVADQIEVKGSVFLSGEFKAEGEVRLHGAVIGGQLDCTGGEFKNPVTSSMPKTIALNLRNANLKGALCLVHPIEHDRPANIRGRVLLRHAAVGQLIDSADVWEPKGEDEVPVALDGFTYDDLGLADSVVDTKFRKRWLERGAAFGELFAPQPYTQLAKALSKAGHESDARQVYLAREWQRLRRIPMTPVDRCLGWLIGLSVGFGYRSRRAAYCLLVIWILGSFVFWSGWQMDRFNPSLPHVYNAYYGDPQKDGLVKQVQRWEPPYRERMINGELKQYPWFSPIIYSLDTLLPIVDLHQEDYWMPVGGLRVYMWSHIAGGWFFTTMAVVGFTGLVRKD